MPATAGHIIPNGGGVTIGSITFNGITNGREAVMEFERYLKDRGILRSDALR